MNKNETNINDPWKIVPVCIGIVLIAVVFAIGAIQSSRQSKIRSELSSMINNTSSNATVFVNGSIHHQPQFILEELRSLDYPKKHHSGSTKEIKIKINDGSNIIELTLARDSRNPDVYWISSDMSESYIHDNIGFLKSTAFKNY